MKKIYPFFKRMLSIVAAIVISSVSLTAHAQEPTWITTVNLSAGAIQTDLQDAINNAVNGSPTTICLQNSITTASTVTVPANKIVRIMSISSTVFKIDANGGDFSVLTVVADGALWLENIKITGANKMGTGGGIYNFGNLGMKNGAEISGNTAYDVAGGVLNGGSATFTMHGNATISYNTSMGTAGGVEVFDGTFTMNDDATISYNTSVSTGGGVFNSYGTFTMNGNATIFNNTTDGVGGGVHNFGATFTMNDHATISNNTANNAGGGVYSNEYTTFTINDNATITSNTALFGGGVTTESANFIMTNGIISNNIATGSPQIEFNDLLMLYGVSSLDELAVANGFADINEAMAAFGMRSIANLIEFLYESLGSGYNRSHGGGVYISDGTFTMTGGSITDNTAENDGGGIFSVDFDYRNPADNTAYSNITIVPPAIVAGNHSIKIQPKPYNYLEFTNRASMPFDGLLLNNDDINYYPTKNSSTTTNDTTFIQRCAQDSITLVCDVVNGGVDPYYQWILNGKEVVGANDSIFKYETKDIDTVQCCVFAHFDCADTIYSQIMIIEMLPKPTLNPISDIEECAGVTINPIIFTGSNYDEVQWVMSGTAVGMLTTGGTGDISSFVATNSGTGASVAYITATPISGSCEGDPITFKITVNPKAKLNAKIKIK